MALRYPPPKNWQKVTTISLAFNIRPLLEPLVCPKNCPKGAQIGILQPNQPSLMLGECLLRFAGTPHDILVPDH